MPFPIPAGRWRVGEAMAEIRIMVVEDQAMIRGAIAALLDLEEDMTVVAQARDGGDALRTLDSLAAGEDGRVGERVVDVVLLDVEMPGVDGITACKALVTRAPGVRVLMLTTFGRPGYVQRSLDAGAAGFIVKDAPSEQLAQAIRSVMAGRRVIDPTLAVETLTWGTSPLTDREAEVLRAVADGGTIADIAKILGLSQGTARNHVSSAMIKTGARTRAEAARIATQAGWL